jgi:hypothetical protein
VSGQMQLRKDGATHVSPYDAVLCVLRRDALKPAGLGGSCAAHFTARRERIDATNEQLELILILRAVSCAMEVSISWIETLQLGVDGGELLTQEECLLLCEEILINGGSDLGADFDNGELLYQNIRDVLKMQ